MSQTGDVDWNTTPAGTAPEGQISELADSPSLAYRITASNVVCAVFVILTVGLRFYTRMHIVRGLGYDDYALLLAVVFWALLVATLEVLLKYGLGRHVWNISLDDFSPHYLLGRVLAAVFYTAAMFFVKTSLLLLYRRLFDVYRFYKRWWFVMTYTIAHTLTAIVLSFFACDPPAAQWDLHIQHRTCISTKTLIAIPIFHCVNDLLILSLPIPLIWSLNLGPKRKAQVATVFFLGSASCIVSICRLIPISKLLHQPRYGDVTWHWTPVAIWTQVELTFCIICACVPILKPFLSRHFPAIFPNNPDTRNRDTAFESPGLSTTIRFPAMQQLQQQQQLQLQLQQQLQEQQQRRQRERAWSTAEHSQVSPRIGGPASGAASSAAVVGPGGTVVRKASTWTIGRMSTRRKVWSLWGRWGASVADVEMGMHGGAGGMFGDDSDRGNSAERAWKRGDGRSCKRRRGRGRRSW
ncbi:Integral membrane protein [Lasiodiplodia theobromae]|uniref:Integral membrane protein n=1 Tax=Lasiodiplodia theobromae TaxID=45133 RepID=UPI0015C3AACB|nr:Integral membrane protein [Lasiodiplodia theobromae]KAF4541742.1 Integral membrane protein [Lasiodiplodia theobromae]